MEEERRAMEAADKLKEVIKQRKVEMDKKKDTMEAEKLEKFMQEERNAEEAARRIRENIARRKQDQESRKEDLEKKKNGRFYA